MMRKLYKDGGGKWFVNPILANHTNLTKRTESEFNDFLAARKLPTVEQLLAQLTAERKEQERQGVTINNIRYGGEPENRQALQEAIEFMDDAGLTEFPKWKDSDGQFHADHPLSDVLDAYRAIGIQRAALIATEGNYAQQITAGKLTDLKKVTW